MMKSAKSLPRRAIAVFPVILLTIALTTCGTLRSMVKDPVLSLESVALTGISLNGADLLCKVSVENPNPFEIPFPQVDWDLFINTNHFIAGTIQNDKKLAARGSTVVDVPLRMTYAGIFNTIQSVKGSKEADYRVAMKLSFDIPYLGDRSWNFEHSGTIPVVRIPKIHSPSFRITRIDFAGAEILCAALIENPNVFEIPFPDLAYDFSIGGNSFVKSSVASEGPLRAEALTPVDIRLNVSDAGHYGAFQALRASGETSCLTALKGRFAIPGFENEEAGLDIAGILPLLKVPSLSFKGIRVKNIGLTRLDFQADWEIENNNTFTMTLKDFAYDLSVNNARWAAGKITGAPVIRAGAKTTVPLDISISALDMVKELGAVISRGNDVAYAVTGNMNLASNLPGLEDYIRPFNLSGATKINK
jgi:LEA14-like dessication related protein